MKSRISTSTISILLGFVLTDVTVYPDAVHQFNTAETTEIMQRIADTVAGRVAGHIDAMEGSILVRRDGRYYPITDEENEDTATPESDDGGQA